MRGSWGPSAWGGAHRLYLGPHRPSSNSKVRLVWPLPRAPGRDPLEESPGLRAPSGSGMRGGGGSNLEPREKLLRFAAFPRNTALFSPQTGKKRLFQGRGSGAGQGAPPACRAANGGGVGPGGGRGGSPVALAQDPSPLLGGGASVLRADAAHPSLEVSPRRARAPITARDPRDPGERAERVARIGGPGQAGARRGQGSRCAEAQGELWACPWLLGGARGRGHASGARCRCAADAGPRGRWVSSTDLGQGRSRPAFPLSPGTPALGSWPNNVPETPI